MIPVKKQVRSIQFKLLGPEDIKKIGKAKIITPELYDVDGYPVDAGLMDLRLGAIDPGVRCRTCGGTLKECLGHPGYIELARPVVHLKYAPQIDTLLRGCCDICGKILLTQEDAKKYPLKERIKKTKAAKKCPHCGVEKEKIKIEKPTSFYVGKKRLFPNEIRERLERIPDEDLKYFAMDTKAFRPERAILTLMLVPPVTIRPSITLESGERSEDDLTHKLGDIVRANQRLWENLNAGAPEVIIEDLWDLLQYHVTTFFDNNVAGIPPARHRSGQPLKTITERIKGKGGRIRHNLTGKRVNYSARSVISPDPFIKIEEVGVPYEIAETVTFPEMVNLLNIEKLKQIILNENYPSANYVIRPDGKRKKISQELKQEILEELEVGYIVERHLQDGDIVLFNRQPSLHKASLMAHQVRVLPYKTFRIHPAVNHPYNADFDGDEMNMHCPQSEESHAEIKELMSLEKHVINIKDGDPVIVPEDYVVSGSYLLTKKTTEFTKKDVMDMLYSVGITELPTADRGRGNYSGKLIFSQILPKTLNIEYTTKLCKILNQKEKCKRCKKEKCANDAYLKIVNGVLISGHLDSEATRHKSLFETIYKHFGSNELVEVYDKYAKLVLFTLQKKGLTIALDEYNASSDIRKEIKQIVKKTITSSNSIIKKYEDKTLPLIPGKDLDETFEVEIIKLTGEMKNTISDIILEEKLKLILSETKIAHDNSTLVASIGGSRGRILNVVNMIALWGQHTTRTGRPKTGFSERVLSLSPKKTNQIGDFGFVDCNFFDGFPPKEYFFHAIGGRQGEVDTGVATKVSGYLYRRLSNALKDLIVQDDLNVVGADGKVIQFIYGDDGLSPDKAYLGKNINFFDE